MTTIDTPSLFASYRGIGGSFDELRAPDGSVRGHWSHLTRALEAMGPVELEDRRRESERLLRNDGATYTRYEDPDGQNAPWLLDPIPLLLSSDEWAQIERGIIQRAELFDLILSDLYGPRELVRKGLLPLELVYAHRGFLRQADQVRLPGPHQLIVYGADLARDHTGQPWVLADFAQAPSGAGYALENRMVISRVFPSLYRDAQVHRLAPFFRALRSSLAALAPAGVEDPRVVVLTPGPLNDAYFEHAYLARYLGYSLVEGSDLTVRDGRVWLRALGGLEPVDVILRRVDGWYGDPLELKPTSQLGTPGLVEAARRGTVSVVNGFGAAVLENAGLLPFLPRLAQHLLGQDLHLPSAATWWCGRAADRSHVLANLPDLVVKPIARRTGRNAVYGWLSSAAELDELRRQIEARPHLYVAQERLSFSSVPCLDGRSLGARHAMLRSFAVARDGSYVAMPGGLTRVSATTDDQLVSAQIGGVSKDTWVLASEPDEQTGFWLHRGPGVAALDPAGSMPSRAAENLFWLGRYAERAETTARLVRAILDRAGFLAGGSDSDGAEATHALLAALTRVTATYPGFIGTGAAARLADPQAELLAVLTDTRRPGSLASSLQSMAAAANAVRDQLSNDTWLALGAVESELLELHDAGARAQGSLEGEGHLQSALATVIRNLLALAGLATESMVRDPGWRFMDAGRRIERGIQLATLLDATVVPVRSTAADSLLLESVLVSVESIITYRRRYRSQAQLATVLDLVLLDATNPRSLAFQLDRLSADVAELPRPASPRLSAEERLVLSLGTELRLADTERLAGELDDGGRRTALSKLLGQIAELLADTSNAIDAGHFTHVGPTRLVVAGQSDAMDATLDTAMP